MAQEAVGITPSEEEEKDKPIDKKPGLRDWIDYYKNLGKAAVNAAPRLASEGLALATLTLSLLIPWFSPVLILGFIFKGIVSGIRKAIAAMKSVAKPGQRNHAQDNAEESAESPVNLKNPQQLPGVTPTESKQNNSPLPGVAPSTNFGQQALNDDYNKAAQLQPNPAISAPTAPAGKNVAPPASKATPVPRPRAAAGH